MRYFLGPYSYTKVDDEDPDELKHRRAQWLIARVLEQANSQRRSPRRFRVCKLKMKIGRRLRRLRRSVQYAISKARMGILRQFMSQFKLWKGAIRDRDAAMNLAPMFG